MFFFFFLRQDKIGLKNVRVYESANYLLILSSNSVSFFFFFFTRRNRARSAITVQSRKRINKAFTFLFLSPRRIGIKILYFVFVFFFFFFPYVMFLCYTANILHFHFEPYILLRKSREEAVTHKSTSSRRRFAEEGRPVAFQ